MRFLRSSLWLFCICGLSQSVPTFADSARGFSESERRSLAKGELVARKTSKRQGQYKLVGGNCWQVINQPLDQVWKELRNVRTFRYWIPGASTVRLVSTKKNKRLIHVQHKYGWIKGGYYMQLQEFDRGRTKTIKVNVDTSRPRSLEAAWGYFRLQPFGQGRTLLTYGIAVDFGDGVVTGLLRPLAHEWLLKVPAQFKKYMSRVARHRFSNQSSISKRSER